MSAAMSSASKRHWRAGTSAVSFDPLTLIERLAAGSSSQRSQGVPAIRRSATNRGLPSASARPSAHLPRCARASLRVARPHRAQAHAGPRCALSRCSRSSLIDRAQQFRPLALVALNLGGATATSLRRRRPDLPPLRRPSPPHRTAHRPGGRAQDPWQLSDCPPSLHGPRRPARANSSTSPEPPAPHAAKHTPRPRLRASE
jgi:hypothetical protein